MICDPGNHWHKDDMEDEEPIPGITEPNYDEHAEDPEVCDDCPGIETGWQCCQNYGDYNDPNYGVDDDVPF